MHEVLDTLKKSKLFLSIPGDAMEELVASLGGHLKRLEKGEFWASEGVRLDQIGIVLEGELSVFRMFTDGREHLVQKLSATYVAGMDIVCTKTQESPYDICAVENSLIYQFPWYNIQSPGQINENCRLQMMQNILMLISHENIRKAYKIEILMQKGLRDRIMTYLLMQQRKTGKDTFQIPFSREEMAAFLCVNRSALSHELRVMEEDGLIEFYKNEFTVCSKK